MQGPGVAAAVRVQQAGVGPEGFVVVLYDSDDDVPDRAEDATREALDAAGATAVVAVAVREYEAWLLAGVESLRSHPSVLEDAAFAGDPESPRDAKGRLRDLMTEPYKETLHQARLTAILDLDRAISRSPSLRRFTERVEQAITARL